MRKKVYKDKRHVNNAHELPCYDPIYMTGQTPIIPVIAGPQYTGPK